MLSRGNAKGLTICFAVLLLDALDTTSIAFVAPVLAHEWNVPASAFTTVFVATSLGAVVGYVVCGPLVQSYGQRMIGIGCVALFGLSTLAMTAAWDIASLSVLRFVAAIGLGGAVPIAIVAATDLVAARHKETVTMLVASGLSAGAVTGGLIGGPLIRAVGWEPIFVLGGVLPLLIAPFFMRILRPAAAPADPFGADESSHKLLAQLFSGGLAGCTALIWLFSFLIFVVTHALIFWTPTLLLELGIERSQAPLGTAAFGLGGLFGNLAILLLVAAMGIVRLLSLTTGLIIVCVLAISHLDLPWFAVLALVAGLGAGAITGCIGEAALAVSIYPRRLRATGVGCATAIGRVGSIFGPAAAGLLLSFGWPGRDVFLFALIPSALALLVLVWLRIKLRRLPIRPERLASPA